MLKTFGGLSTVALLVAGGLDAAQAPVAVTPPVRQIDHIVIRTNGQVTTVEAYSNGHPVSHSACAP